MNWGLIGWFAGVLLTLYMIKFVWIAIRSLFNKKTMSTVLEVTGEKVHDASESLAEKIREKAEARRTKKTEMDDEPPVLKDIIRR